MTDLRDQLERMATRGEARGVDALAEAAFEDAAARASVSPPPRPPSRRWRVAIAAGAAAAVLVAVVVFARPQNKRAVGPLTSSSSSSVTAPFPADARGWIFRDGEIRDVRDDSVVATFPFAKTEWPPVRVDGGFVAVGTDHNLWMAHDDGSPAAQLDSSVSGVAASPDGTKIAYSKVFNQGTTAELRSLDITTGKELASAPFEKFARVVGYSDPEVLLDTGDGGGASAALWDPSGGKPVVLLDGFGGVGGVGHGLAVLHEGDGPCGTLVSIVDGAVHPIDLQLNADDCAAQRWSFNASGSDLAGFGIGQAPAPLRMNVDLGQTTVGSTSVSDAIWVTDSTLAAIDSRGELVSCDTSADCTDVRPENPGPIEVETVWLIAPRRDGSDRSGAVLPPQPALAPDGLSAVQMVSSSIVLAAGPRVFLRSDDGGTTWRTLPAETPPCDAEACARVTIGQLDMIDSTTGWATSNFALYRTTDGQDWKLQPTGGIEHGLANVHFVSPTEGWGIDALEDEGVIGWPDGKLVSTTDGGATWSQLDAPSQPQSVCFTKRSDGWLATRDAVYRSTDGGATWSESFTSPLAPSNGNGVASLQCADGGGAWVQFGQYPTHLLAATSSGGTTWSTVDTAPGGDVAPFSIIDAETAFFAHPAVGGQPVSLIPITNTTTLGSPIALGIVIPVGMSFADATHGVVVGDGGPSGAPIWVTRNGGQNWSPITP
jgi:hypothetical protein